MPFDRVQRNRQVFSGVVVATPLYHQRRDTPFSQREEPVRWRYDPRGVPVRQNDQGDRPFRTTRRRLDQGACPKQLTAGASVLLLGSPEAC